MKKQLYSISCLMIAMVAVGVFFSINVLAEQSVVVKPIVIEQQAKKETHVLHDYLSHSETEQEPKMLEQKPIPDYPDFEYKRDWSEDETYLLARIAMAEAEGENIQTKTLVIMSVLNRVQDENFPNSIKGVIFQQVNGVYQYSCIGNGRWDRVKPNEDCYEAVDVVRTTPNDYSGGALYFENCADEDNWHSRNLDFLYKSEELRFYK